MLSVAKVARGREAYYLATVAAGREDPGGLIEPDGVWLGDAAGSLGLSGVVDGSSLSTLLEGVDPLTGEILSPWHGRVRVAAYDCTFSTPKSVSVLHALGPGDARSEIGAGHAEAARAALGYLERRAARVRRRLEAGGAALAVPAGGFVAAGFLHRASRAPDPHLHSHVLVANLAPGPDGRWSALDARGLFLELGAARDLYETHLRAELSRRLGVSWRELRGAWADLAGIDPAVVRAFSRRHAEIRAALAGTPGGWRADQVASLRTRAAKDLTTPYEVLVEGWRERSYQLGVSEGRLAGVLERPQEARTARDRWPDAVLGARGALAGDGTCRRTDLLRARCRTLREGGTVAEVERDVDALVISGKVVASGVTGRARRLSGPVGAIPSGVDEPVFTTPEVVAVEASLARNSSLELFAYPPGGRLGALDALARLGALDALARLGAPGGPGAPGPGQRVVAVTAGAAAARGFEAATGIPSVPLLGASRLSDLLPGASPLTGRDVLMVPDAHRFGPWQLAEIADAARATSARVLLVAPAGALESGSGSLARLSTALRAARLEPPGRPVPVAARPHRCRVSGSDVVIASDGIEARAAMLAEWRNGRSSGAAPVLVASEPAVLDALRVAVRAEGGSDFEVGHPRALGSESLLAQGSDLLVLLGGAQMLDAARPPEAPGGPRRVHVVIAPVGMPEDERLGRAAEAVRPGYLVDELGPLPAGLPGRAAWRAGAGAIEGFRQRWGVDDPTHAFGDRAVFRKLGRGAVTDLASTRRSVGEAVRSLDRSAPARDRPERAGPGRTLASRRGPGGPGGY